LCIYTFGAHLTDLSTLVTTLDIFYWFHIDMFIVNPLYVYRNTMGCPKYAKCTGEVVAVHATNAYKGVTGSAPLVLNLILGGIKLSQ